MAEGMASTARGALLACRDRLLARTPDLMEPQLDAMSDDESADHALLHQVIEPALAASHLPASADPRDHVWVVVTNDNRFVGVYAKEQTARGEAAARQTTTYAMREELPDVD